MIIKYKPLTKTERETIVKSTMRGREWGRERGREKERLKVKSLNW